MPEIKNNFTGGKMNKDLDERLIPNGQYRDAMNIQVLTSEGSDVGTVQNILGNLLVPGQGFVGNDATCVGSISDEKNDKLYWFVVDSGGSELLINGTFDSDTNNWFVNTGTTVNPTFTNLPSSGWSYDSSNQSILATNVEKFQTICQSNVEILKGRTYLIKCEISNFSGTGDISPYIVDQHGTWTRPGAVHQIVGNSYFDYRDYVATDNGIYEWVLRASVGGVPGQEIAWQPAGWTPYYPSKIAFQNRAETDSSAPSYQATNLLNCNIDNISMRVIGASYIIQYDTKTNRITPVFVDTNNSVLKFEPNRLITGINIIDDLLFWTDNNSEPKKINIKRSIEGTHSSGNRPTCIINPKQDLSLNNHSPSIKEEHIAVLKKSPKNPPTIEAIGFRDDDLDYTGVIKISDNFDHTNSFINSSLGRIHDFNFLNIGSTFSTIIEKDINNKSNFNLQWQVGDKVVLKEFNEDGSPPEVPIIDYTIKGTITDSQINSFTNTNYLLTLNGNLLDGNTYPDYWSLAQGNTGTAWTWDKTNGKIIADGSPLSEWAKAYNNNDNAGPAGSGYGDIVDGRAYRIKYTVEPPDSGEMLGVVDVKLFSKDPGTTGDGHYWHLGEHTTPGSYDHEIVFDNIDQGANATLPAGKGDVTYQGNGTYLNSIMFQSELGASTVGQELADITEYTSSSTGAPAGLTYSIGLSGAPGVPNHFAWARIKSNEVDFYHTGIIDSVFVGPRTAYLNNIQELHLEDQAQYEIELIVSEMTFTGTGQMQLGVSTNGGLPNDVRIRRFSGGGHGPVAVQATASDQWTGLGGYIKKTFTATSTSRIDLFAYASDNLTSTQGPTGTINVSLKKIETPSFKGKISNVSVEEIDETVASVEVKIDAIDGVPPVVREGETSLNYAIDLFQQEEDRVLEDKFARFAYRYKYADGEISSMSPFSEVAFIPGVFDYHPKKGHNLGMFNNIKTLRIKDYSKNLPKNVTGIDILYKEENSNNIYLVDSPKDFKNPNSFYLIQGDQLKGGVLPSNQLLRPWDNVPRRALAQEIVGNRIVYGNYVQNYNLTKSNGDTYNLDMLAENSPKQSTSKNAQKSIKSLRDYQVGVVFGDEYGRETPILTNPNAVAKINKANSSTANQISVSIYNVEHPVNMKYFKFFIKDNSGEYYNLAMDRYYDGEDGNIWLSFPSSERNKIDIDDYLILKKGVGETTRDPITNELKNVIKDKAQYKILDIKNEAPDYIKRKETLVASARHLDANKVFLDSDLPTSGDANFAIDHDRVSGSAVANLHETFSLDNDVEYYISLSNTITKRVSDRYKIISLHGDIDGGTPTWNITLEKPFSDEISDFTNDESGINSSSINDETFLNIYKIAIDNSASYKFDGKFFVKIYNDDIFRKALKEPISDIKQEYKSKNISRKIYSLKTITGTNRIEKIATDLNGSIDVNTSNAFFDRRNNLGSVGLNRDVATNPGATQGNGESLFTWQNFIQACEDFYSQIGTLNNLKVTQDGYSLTDISNNIIISDPTRDPAVWMDYDAYFRGINIYAGTNSIGNRVDTLDINDVDADSEQNFQDVWFIDNATHNGHFKYSNIAGVEDSDFTATSGWKTWTERWRTQSMGVRSWGSGEYGTSEIELAFGGIQPVKWINGDEEWATDPTFFDLENENTNYSKEQKDFIEQIAIGSQFRFKEDPQGTIYTVTGVDKLLKIRYENLNGYAGGFRRNYGDDSIIAGLKPGNLRPPILSTYHARALKGEAVGMHEANIGLFSNVVGQKQSNKAWERTEVKGQENSITWKISSFLRPSNYTHNWRITVDKNINEHWNPAEDTNTEISNQLDPITLTTAAAGTANSIQVTGLTGTGTNKNKLSVGMVLKKYNDGADRTMNPPAIVTSINTTNDTIYFKTYDGSTGWATGVGTPTDIGSGETLYFYQFPMNGLSPNAAKNLNFFRDGKGIGGGTAGTDAVGYTWEWVEEKTSRSEEEILPANPAIWETKPKQTEIKDLDIYHEASEAIPIFEELTKENMLELIPIGSTVEHEGSKTIGNNVKVIDVNPVTGSIILSEPILVEELSGAALWLAWGASFGWAGSSTLLEKFKVTAGAGLSSSTPGSGFSY
jgi:hypothetical protein